MPIKCQDSGPARNHFFITLDEVKRMITDPCFCSVGFASVCDHSIKTYQLHDPVTNHVGPSYRYYKS